LLAFIIQIYWRQRLKKNTVVIDLKIITAYL